MIPRIALLVACASLAGCAATCDVRPSDADVSDAELLERLAPLSTVAPREGLAAAILIDVSGSMEESVVTETGEEMRKIEVARRAGRELVNQFVRYAQEHPDQPVLLGLYEFSQRDGQPDARPLMAMSAPDLERASRALAAAVAEGGTPIGNAMITAKRELDTTGLTRRHLLVITDGDNTDGVPPDRVAAAIGQRPEAERPSIYFVAFDIDASRFTAVREAGGLVLAAANAKELNETLDMLLRGKILVEQ